MKPNTNNPLYVVFYAAAVSAAFTGAIMALHVGTRDIVRRNEALLRKRALVRLFGFDGGGKAPLTDEQIGEIVQGEFRQGTGRLIVDSAAEADRIVDPRTKHAFQVVRAYDKDRTLLGYALPVWGVGFWARIDGLVAVDPKFERMLGIVFLQHGETPGLGGRITERDWTDKFIGLDVSEPGMRPYLYLGGEKPAGGDPRQVRHVDSITGATGTSKAVERFLNARLPEIRRAAVAAGIVQTEEETDSPQRRGARRGEETERQ